MKYRITHMKTLNEKQTRLEDLFKIEMEFNKDHIIDIPTKFYTLKEAKNYLRLLMESEKFGIKIVAEYDSEGEKYES